VPPMPYNVPCRTTCRAVRRAVPYVVPPMPTTCCAVRRAVPHNVPRRTTCRASYAIRRHGQHDGTSRAFQHVRPRPPVTVV
jgi:hypothetical protein